MKRGCLYLCVVSLIGMSTLVYATCRTTETHECYPYDDYSKVIKGACLEMMCPHGCIEKKDTHEAKCCPAPEDDVDCRGDVYKDGCLIGKKKVCSSDQICDNEGKCVDCPLDSSILGKGEETSVSGCKCNTPKTHWDETMCTCPTTLPRINEACNETCGCSVGKCEAGICTVKECSKQSDCGGFNSGYFCHHTPTHLGRDRFTRNLKCYEGYPGVCERVDSIEFKDAYIEGIGNLRRSLKPLGLDSAHDWCEGQGKKLFDISNNRLNCPKDISGLAAYNQVYTSKKCYDSICDDPNPIIQSFYSTGFVERGVNLWTSEPVAGCYNIALRFHGGSSATGYSSGGTRENPITIRGDVCYGKEDRIETHTYSTYACCE